MQLARCHLHAIFFFSKNALARVTTTRGMKASEKGLAACSLCKGLEWLRGGVAHVCDMCIAGNLKPADPLAKGNPVFDGATKTSLVPFQAARFRLLAQWIPFIDRSDELLSVDKQCRTPQKTY